MTNLAPANSEKIRVDIWSDVACPWCYIGKRRFESALGQFPQRDQVEVVWHSFELDPSARPLNPIAMRDGLAMKYSISPAQAQGSLDHMTQTAAQEGLEYHFDRVKLANTFQAHQLIHYAAEQGQGDAMKERLLRAYMSEGQNVNDLDTLQKLAAEVGLDAGAARAALEAGTYAQAVRYDEQQAQQLGITGVPFFVLGGKYGVSGAQAPETLLGALSQVWAEQHPTPLTMLGQDAPAEGCEDGQCAVPQHPNN